MYKYMLDHDESKKTKLTMIRGVGKREKKRDLDTDQREGGGKGERREERDRKSSQRREGIIPCSMPLNSLPSLSSP